MTNPTPERPDAAEEAACPYVQKSGEGSAFCALAETGIKVFERKASEAERLAKDWQHEFNMYRSAWLRELGGRLVPKTHDIDAFVLTTRRLREERDRLRAAIIKHRSQKADDRCVEDDDELYAALGDGIKCDRRVGDKAAMLANCARFIERRCEGGGWPTYAELEAALASAEDRGAARERERIVGLFTSGEFCKMPDHPKECLCLTIEEALRALPAVRDEAARSERLTVGTEEALSESRPVGGEGFGELAYRLAEEGKLGRGEG